MGDLSKKAIVKRKYSRAGCKECKRRKIKCDEVHPLCGNCARVSCPCVFPDPKYRNKPRQSQLRQLLNENDEKQFLSPTFSNLNDGLSRSPSESASAHVNHRVRNDNLDMMLFENVFDDANTLVHGLADFDIFANGPKTNTSQSSPASDNLKPFHSNIILNEPSHDNVFFEEDELKNYLNNGVELVNNDDFNRFWNQFNEFISVESEQPKTDLSNVELCRTICQKYKLSAEEQKYFEEIVLGELVLYLFPFSSKLEDNEVVHILLEYSLVFKYLVYALMALCASCLFTMTKDRKHLHSQRKFSAVCTKLLVSAFADLKSNKNSLWHIEGLIMTVLLLTMLFSDMYMVETTKVPISWISHLHEARSLLIKYNTLKSQRLPNKPDSPGILIAKLLFFCYDWISKLSMPILEVTKTDLNDLWILTGQTDFLQGNSDYYRSLLKLGLVVPISPTQSGFNLFMAMTNEVVGSVYQLLDIISDINKNEDGSGLNQADPERICDLMATLKLCLLQSVVPGANSSNNYLIEVTSPAHPLYSGPEPPVILPAAAYGKDTDNPLETKYYSYCDVSQMLHCYFLYLKILTTPGLIYVPRSHPMLRCIVHKIMSLLFFVKSKKDTFYRPEVAFCESENYYLPKGLFDLRTVMIQLPFRMCIALTDKEDDFEKLELFFHGLVKLGSGNSEVAVSRIKKARERARKKSMGNAAVYNEYDYLPEGFPIF